MSLPDPPTGTVTFLFTDIEGSTRLLRELGRGFTPLQDLHADVLRGAIAAEDGHEVRTEGDSFFVAFRTAGHALRAAVEAQRGLAAAAWPPGGPLRIRIGMHTGEAVLGGDDYVGLDVNLAARIAAAAHGGQVVLSDATRALVRDTLPSGVAIRELGTHTLKDFDDPQPLFDLVIDELPSEFPPIRTTGSPPPSTFPSPRTSFIGRDRELAEVGALLRRARLVTLTGPGGTGKTRIALGVAAREARAFRDGVHLVDLSAVTDPDLVPSTIVTSLGVRGDPAGDPVEALIEHLRTKDLLLVLDNLEQVLDAAAIVNQLLDAAPDLRVLTTSRVPLHLSDEHEYDVDPLALPELEAAGDVERLATYESVMLFVDRAGAVRRGFQLTDENAAAITGIVERLDGLPLAIELAASRVKTLAPQALLERLERRLPLLGGGPRDHPARQRTLRDAIDWSYELLEEPEARLFARVSVFSGGFTVDAAEAVCGPGLEVDVLDGIEALVDKSLVTRAEGIASARYRMLETIREFGVERLEASSEHDEMRRRHVRFVEAMTEVPEHDLLARDRSRMDRLEEEHDNIRVALQWSIDSGDAEPGLRIAGALWRYWQVRNHLAEGRRWTEELLALPAAAARTSARAAALTALGSLAYYLRDVDEVRPAYEESLEISHELGDRAGEADGAYNLGFASLLEGDHTTAKAYFQEAERIYRDLDDPVQYAHVLAGLGLVTIQEGDLERASDLIEEARQTFLREQDLWGITFTAGQLASVAMRQGDYERARMAGLESLEGSQALGALGWNAVAVQGLAVLAIRTDDPERGTRLSGVMQHLWELSGGEAPPAITGLENPLDLVGDSLPPERIEELLAEGRAMGVHEALAYAREGASAPPQEVGGGRSTMPPSAFP
jgi:predicted ATPase/class 3 adenylate cyclase